MIAQLIQYFTNKGINLVIAVRDNKSQDRHGQLHGS
jgi:hypothetical protein